MFRLSIVFATGTYLELKRYELERTAISLVTQGVYGNPYILPTGPTAHNVPGYTLLVAAIFKVFGTGTAGELVKEVLSCIAGSLRSLLLPWFAVRMGIDRRTALAAGVISVIWIGALETELKGGWEACYAALLLLILTARHFVRPVPLQTWRQAAITGVLWGIMFLVNPAAIPVLGAFFLLDVYRLRPWPSLSFWRNAALVAGVSFLLLVPWGLRNRAVLGSFIATRSNLGLELYQAYAPGAHWVIDEYMQSPTSPHPSNNPQEAKGVRELGEVAYNREKERMAVRFIQNDPRAAVRLASLHFVHFWFPPGRNLPHALVLAGLTLSAIYGFVLLWSTHRELALQLGAVLASYPLIYYVTIWQARYRFPIEWILVLLAAVALTSTARRLIRI